MVKILKHYGAIIVYLDWDERQGLKCSRCNNWLYAKFFDIPVCQYHLDKMLARYIEVLKQRGEITPLRICITKEGKEAAIKAANEVV